MRIACRIRRRLSLGRQHRLAALWPRTFRRFRFELDISGRPQRQQHSIDCLLARLKPLAHHQSLADEFSNPVHFRRGIQPKGEEAPREGASTRQPPWWRGPQCLELRFCPVLFRGAPFRHLLFQGLLCFQQLGILRLLRNAVVFLAPTKEFHVVFMSQSEHEPLCVKLGAARPAKDLVGTARIDQFLLARGALQ